MNQRGKELVRNESCMQNIVMCDLKITILSIVMCDLLSILGHAML